MNEVRRQNLRRLIDDKFSGRDADFARYCGIEPARISQVLSKTYRDGKNFGEKAARNIEQAAGLPALFLDQSDADFSTQLSANETIADNLAKSQRLDNLTAGEAVELLSLFAKIPPERRETILHLVRVASIGAADPVVDHKTQRR